MDTKAEFARRKRTISIILFIIACLMLSLFFLRNTVWDVAVVVIAAILVLICRRLNRCPQCHTRIHNDDASTCENCGCQLKD